LIKPETRKFNSFTDVLDFAIAREREAHLFYIRLADMVKKPDLVKAIRNLATEEVEHKIRLEAVKAGETTLRKEDVGNLNISNYVSDVEPNTNMSYVDLLIVAMKKENLSYKLYTDIAAISKRNDLRDIFLKLAQEEAGHKLRFEFEYDLEKF
jgi:rubrerythrin